MTMKRVLTLWLAIGLFATAPVAGQIGSDTAQFWVHHTNADGCCDIWFNDLKDDPAHTLDAVSNILLPSDEMFPENPGAPAWPPQGSNINYVMAPPLSAPLVLDAGGMVHFDAYVGGDDISVIVGVPGPPDVGIGTLTLLLMQGDEIIADSGPLDAMWVGEYLHFEVDAAVQKNIISPADGDVVYRFRFSGVSGVFKIGGGDSVGHSSVTVPLAGSSPDAGIVYADLAGAVDIDHEFAAAVSDTYVFNWTAPHSPSHLDLRTEPATGSVHVTIQDGGGASLYDETLSGDADDAAELTGATGGPWTLTLAYEGFTGTLQLALTEPATSTTSTTATGTPSGTATTSGSSSGTASTTGFPPEDEGNRLPGPAFIFVLAAFAAVAVVRRRLKRGD